MNLNQLKYFLVVAETGSFTKASERLFITQPSLSVGIQKLEKDLGVRLFERRKKNVFLTRAGKYFRDKAKNILNEIESVKQELNPNCDSHNIIRLGTLNTIGVEHLARLISNFCKVYPHIVIEQLSGNIMKLRNWLEKGDIDIAINVLGKMEDSRTAQILWSDKYSVLVAASHPLSERKSLSFSELDRLPYIDRLRCEKRDELHRLFMARGICPKITCRLAHDGLSNALVYAGIGLAVMPGHSSISGIVHLPFSDLNLIRQVGLVWRTEQNLKAVGLFREFSESFRTGYSNGNY
jgi:DNA-binding transcriptional LysR family regulator